MAANFKAGFLSLVLFINDHFSHKIIKQVDNPSLVKTVTNQPEHYDLPFIEYVDPLFAVKTTLTNQRTSLSV